MSYHEWQDICNTKQTKSHLRLVRRWTCVDKQKRLITTRPPALHLSSISATPQATRPSSVDQTKSTSTYQPVTTAYRYTHPTMSSDPPQHTEVSHTHLQYPTRKHAPIDPLRSNKPATHHPLLLTPHHLTQDDNPDIDSMLGSTILTPPNNLLPIKLPHRPQPEIHSNSISSSSNSFSCKLVSRVFLCFQWRH